MHLVRTHSVSCIIFNIDRMQKIEEMRANMHICISASKYYYIFLSRDKIFIG